MKCLILAGGFGTRLYPLTLDRAKALLEYKGKPIISHIVEKVPQNIAIMVNTNKKFEADFHQWKQTVNRKVEILVEEVLLEDQKLGAVGSLNFWIENKQITEDLLVIAGDNYFEFDLAQFIASYDGKHTLVAIYDIGDKDKASQFGVVQLDGHRIAGFQEKPAKPKSSLVATACYILPPRIFPLLHQYCQQGKKDNLGSFIAYLIDRDEVHAYTFTEPWVDIGSVGNLI
jgi:Nucleoside-diphosphate-sugar pyrophosphorylase involved in lipopolysaccharide biosynthesis/translation initiation factor 2B, gamma/epsilon subunits (eIF-2Bgamma/eIF-2Bepsilon)